MTNGLVEFAKNHALNIALIVTLAYVSRKFVMVFLRRIIRGAIKADRFKTSKDEKQREDTLISTVSAGLHVSIWVLALLLLLSELGVNIAPLIAGAGIAGLAIGFGAQSLVKDFLSGMFILAENQYRVGDVVELNGLVSGTVERVTLRETVLRDLDGKVHHMSNGEVTLATNMTMEYSKVNLNIGVGYNTDIEKLEKLVNDIGIKLSEEADWQDYIIEAPRFLRINDFAESAIEIKIVGRTAPSKQWSVTGELRKRLKIAFDKNGIEIPFPQRVLHQSKTSFK